MLQTVYFHRFNLVNATGGLSLIIQPFKCCNQLLWGAGYSPITDNGCSRHTLPTQDAEPLLSLCWATVFKRWPNIKTQQWLNVFMKSQRYRPGDEPEGIAEGGWRSARPPLCPIKNKICLITQTQILGSSP